MIVNTPGVVRIVGAGNVPLPVDDEEIEALQRIAQSSYAAQPHPFLRVGQQVSITDGALRGLSGTLVRFASGSRLVVSVTLLQRAVASEIDEALVMPAAPFPPAIPDQHAPGRAGS